MLSTTILLFIPIALCFLSSFAFLYQRRQYTRQRQQFTAVSNDLDRALRCLNSTEGTNTDPGFASDLEEAAIKTKLRHYTTAKRTNTEDAGSIPDRYRHVSTLANHGLDDEAISEILQIPKGEAAQLLKLVKLTGLHA